MANPVWPGTLPAFVEESGYSERLPAQSIETAMETGPSKTRRRFSVNVRPFGFTVKMSDAQFAIFDAFYLNTLQGGSLKFDWVHPRTRTAATFQFRLPPPSMRIEGEARVVTMTMEMVP
jgi:hypothetical protein